MTIQEAQHKYNIKGFDEKYLEEGWNQQAAFEECRCFLSKIDKIKSQNGRRTSYGYKHIIEEPGGYFDLHVTDSYWGYIYEGTFILAALTEGFTGTPYATVGEIMEFNISEKSLERVTKDFAEKRRSLKNISHNVA